MAEPDLILHGGTIITLDRESTVADPVSIREGRIAAVGPAPALLKEAGPGTRRIDLAGRTVVPGFSDAHAHMDREGLRGRGGVPIAGLRSVAEIVEAVREAARSALPGEWIVVMPMGDPPIDYVNPPDLLREGRFPTRADLDAVAPKNPVYIHAVWGWWCTPPFPSVANSLALAEARITRDTAAPYNVERLSETGMVNRTACFSRETVRRSSSTRCSRRCRGSRWTIASRRRASERSSIERPASRACMKGTA